MNPQLAIDRRSRVEEFQRKHKVGFLTLMFTDMVGSTRMKQELGDQGALEVIEKHHASVRELLGEFQEAEEINTAGDSFFIVFAKPSDATRFALFLQARLAAFEENKQVRVQDRIGIHVGEVVIQDSQDGPKERDLYGLQVDICARVMSLSLGNQILMSRAAFDSSRQVLKSGFRCRGKATVVESWLV